MLVLRSSLGVRLYLGMVNVCLVDRLVDMLVGDEVLYTACGQTLDHRLHRRLW